MDGFIAEHAAFAAALIVILGAVLGYLVKDRLSSERTDIKELREEVGDLKDELRKEYVRRDDWQAFKTELRTWLQRLEDKLDAKADK